MAKSVERLRAFSVLIQLYPGSTLAQVRKLERRIEDYAESHDIEIGGHQLTYVVSSFERTLTTTDQVDLIDCLTSQHCISTVRLTPLRDQTDLKAAEEEGYLSVPTCDMVTIGVKLLYGARRISADVYLQALGGFVRPAVR